MNFGSKKICNAMLFIVTALLLSSCASLSPNGVGRVKRYSFVSGAVPNGFDGYKIAFISDTHYPSLFTQPRLKKLTRKLQKESPDVLLLGGDYVTSTAFLNELFDSLSAVEPVDGVYAVLGNHERRYKEAAIQSMNNYGVVLLADSVVGKNDYASLAIVEAIEIEKEVYSIGCKKGGDLDEKINNALVELLNEGKIEALAAKYNVRVTDSLMAMKTAK